jgi:DNA-directed RNA polymerase subunit RPC12/RpoP
MPIPEEFVKKRTEVTISRASLQELACRSCGAKIDSRNITGGYARCEYCGGTFSLDVGASDKGGGA